MLAALMQALVSFDTRGLLLTSVIWVHYSRSRTWDTKQKPFVVHEQTYSVHHLSALSYFNITWGWQYCQQLLTSVIKICVLEALAGKFVY